MTMKKKDWKKIDRRLVDVGREMGRQFKGLLQLDVNALRKELEIENKYKVGRPLKTPPMLVQIAFLFHTLFHVKWRQVEGLLKELVDEELVVSYRRLLERAKRYEVGDAVIIQLSGGRGKICIFPEMLKDAEDFFIDSTGLSLKQGGLWRTIRFKNPLNGKHVKLHLMVNRAGGICAFAVTISTVADSEVFRTVVRYVPKGSRIYGDGAYSARKNYEAAEKQRVELHSPPRKNARSRAKGVPSYRNEVLLYQKPGYHGWAEITGYKHRFNKEFVFASYKSIFGETLSDRTVEPIFNRVFVHTSILNEVSKAYNI